MIVVSVTLLLPLYAQEDESPEAESGEYTAPVENIEMDENIGESGSHESAAVSGERVSQKEGFGEDFRPEQPKKEFKFARQHFELGFDVEAGVDNDIIGMNDFFKKNIVLDLDEIVKLAGDDGLNLNAALNGGLIINVKNIAIKDGIWDFGFFSGADGGIHGNIPQDLFTLISEGNINKKSFTGEINASGGVYAGAGLRASAKYDRLRLGVRPTLYTPLVFIPKSGIIYDLQTEQDISLTTSGEINVYSPIGEDGQFNGLQFGFDMSLEGEYELLPSFLDVGGTFSHIPIAPAKMENRMKLTMSELDFTITGDDFLDGNDISEKIPDFKNLEFKETYDIAPRNVLRPLRFDVYARYKPLYSELLAIKPNLGFTIDINEKQGYFNAGLEGQLNIRDLFLLHLGTGYEEAVWKHRLGFILNLRAFELGIEAALRSRDFAGSFGAKGLGLNMGLRFGW